MEKINIHLRPAQHVATVGLGIALYVTLSMSLQVPFFENYYLCLGYIVLAVYCTMLGPAAGAIVGAAGCVLHCFAINGLRGMPGWALGNLFTGIALGFLLPTVLKLNKSIVRISLAILLMVATTAIAILGIKSLTEVILYSQPMWARMIKNSYAFFANSFVLVLSIPLCLSITSLYRKISISR